MITEAPLTAEAREALLYDIFTDHLPHLGELFLPTDGFYGNLQGPKQAQHMLGCLCRWLAVKPGYIGLEFEPSDGETPDGRRYTIRIESDALSDEFVLGATLAYALTKYLVERHKQILLPAADQVTMLATASNVFGLGLVISNGLSPKYKWADSWRHTQDQHAPRLIGNYPETSYSYLLLAFIKKHRMSPLQFRGHLTPWTAKRLGMALPRHSSAAVTEIRHKIRVANIKMLGIAWLSIMICGISVFIIMARSKPVSAKITQAQDQVTFLATLKQQCKQSLNYDRQYADHTDIQVVRTLNAESLRCESLSNQQAAAEQTYQHLIEPTN